MFYGQKFDKLTQVFFFTASSSRFDDVLVRTQFLAVFHIENVSYSGGYIWNVCNHVVFCGD